MDKPKQQQNPLAFIEQGWGMAQVIFPPWHNLTSPLIQYEIRSRNRVGRTPWFSVIVSTLALVGCVLVIMDEMNNLYQVRSDVEIIGWAAFRALLVGLVAYQILVRWRLLAAMVLRAGTAVAARRQTGDWELIFITPMPKARWLAAQMTALGWQIWPLVRGVLLAQTGLALVIGAAAIYSQYDNTQNDSLMFYSGANWIEEERDYLPTPLYALTLFPAVVLMIGGASLEMAALSTMAMRESSRSRNAASTFSQTIGSVLWMRFQWASIFWLCLITLGLMYALLFESDFSLSALVESLTAAPLLCLLCLPYIFATVAIWEILPMILALFFIGEQIDTPESVGLWAVCLIALIVAYILAPLRSVWRLKSLTVQRLERRER